MWYQELWGKKKKIHSKAAVYFYTYPPFDVIGHERHFIMTTSALLKIALQALHVISVSIPIKV